MLRFFRFLPHTARPRQAAWLAMTAMLAIGCTSQRGAANPPQDAPAAAPLPATSAATSAAPAATGEAELSRFAPAGTTLRMSARGDLDGDGDQDALIVVEPGTAEASTLPRALYLLRRGADGALQVAVQSPEAILCRTCGGMTGDPLHSIRAGRGEFTLRFEGGSRELWSSEYRFAYASNRDGWRLTGIVFNGFDRADGASAQQSRNPVDFGDVALADFDPDNFPADALP